MNQKLYKIRSAEEHFDMGYRYSKGGTWDWSKEGKAWASLNSLKKHIRYVQAYGSFPKYIPGCVVEVFEVIPTEEFSLDELL